MTTAGCLHVYSHARREGPGLVASHELGRYIASNSAGDTVHSVDKHGYPEATVDGFKIGMFVSYEDAGDAWVEAPDGGIGTLIWESGEPTYFKESIAPDPTGRWGTYAVRLRRWERWKVQRD
jgi:hypothetical protein